MVTPACTADSPLLYERKEGVLCGDMLGSAYSSTASSVSSVSKAGNCVGALHATIRVTKQEGWFQD